MEIGDKKGSLYLQLFWLIVISGVLTCGILVCANYAGDVLIEKWYYSSDYEQKKNDYYINDLQKYIDKYRVRTKDSGSLKRWVYRQKVVSISVYKDGIIVFDAEYPDQKMWEENITAKEYEWESYYDVSFLDGPARVSIWGVYSYQFYNYFHVSEILMGSILFICFVLLGIRRKMKYIAVLSNEIKILESGNLDYQITIQGHDELSDLAKGLDSMRLSFSELVQREEDIAREHKKVITEMSHDLRTPITSILLYLEILKKGAVKDNDQLVGYLEKIENKTQRMKRLTEHLFKYSLVTGENDIELEKPEYFEVLFYDILSDTFHYLKNEGFEIEFDVGWHEQKISVYMDYVSRIMDNITSNIVKYADKRKPVRIKSIIERERVGFSFRNSVKQKEDTDISPDSSNIGLQSVRYMIEKMNGNCVISEDNCFFEITVLLPIYREG